MIWAWIRLFFKEFYLKFRANFWVPNKTWVQDIQIIGLEKKSWCDLKIQLEWNPLTVWVIHQSSFSLFFQLNLEFGFGLGSCRVGVILQIETHTRQPYQSISVNFQVNFNLPHIQTSLFKLYLSDIFGICYDNRALSNIISLVIFK